MAQNLWELLSWCVECSLPDLRCSCGLCVSKPQRYTRSPCPSGPNSKEWNGVCGSSGAASCFDSMPFLSDFWLYLLFMIPHLPTGLDDFIFIGSWLFNSPLRRKKTRDGQKGNINVGRWWIKNAKERWRHAWKWRAYDLPKDNQSNF